MAQKKTKAKMEHRDLRRVFEVRAKAEGEATDVLEVNPGDQVIEGRAVTYGEKTKLFTWDDTDYFEVVEPEAFKNADMSDVFLRYNHKDTTMVLARTRNKTLALDNRDDGLYVLAKLADTQAGRDLHKLVVRGDVDAMSFAFTEKEEYFDKETNTWSVRDIDKLYDVSVVEQPAYQNTTVYARRLADLEKRKENLERLEQRRKRVSDMNTKYIKN